MAQGGLERTSPIKIVVLVLDWKLYHTYVTRGVFLGREVWNQNDSHDPQGDKQHNKNIYSTLFHVDKGQYCKEES